MPSGASCEVIMAMGKTPCEVIVAKTPVSARTTLRAELEMRLTTPPLF